MKSLRIALASAASLALLASPGLTSTKAVAQTPPKAGAAGWPQTTSDLKPDPLIRFGRLPNGMRLRPDAPHATPSGHSPSACASTPAR